MASDDYVSPYLLRPLRSYAQALRERSARHWQQSQTSAKPALGRGDDLEVDDARPHQ